MFFKSFLLIVYQTEISRRLLRLPSMSFLTQTSKKYTNQLAAKCNDGYVIYNTYQKCCSDETELKLASWPRLRSGRSN
jgi:hypothetical protein